eukprot:TRINITY_DN6105_c0_g1_i1.p1 TRINITY_DN6105_c0_g1~~TRINITY_DN6105_c0_g1_i1.p1  ORF type:complete len:452 (-),score=72.71 TRINITY_DN6105_c0_g1_i1:3-1358(-)
MRRLLDYCAERPHLAIWVDLNETDALEQAKESDRRHAAGRPLSIWDGVPVAVKDEIDMRGYYTAHGGLVPPWLQRATRDDIIVTRFRAAGAVLVGKTTMDEYGVQPTGFNARLNGPRNPYDRTRYSGGSSSGSAVAVALGLIPVAVGFDGGGSSRVPAALSGVFGLSPTFTRIPFDGEAPEVSSFIHAGPLTATATDAARVYKLLAPPDPEHFYTAYYGGPPPAPHTHEFDAIADLTGVRVGVFWEWLHDSDAVVAASAAQAIAFLERRGAVVVNISIPHLEVLSLAYSLSIAADMAHRQDRKWDAGHQYQPATKMVVAVGRAVAGVELAAAARLRGWAHRHFQTLFEMVDVIATPTCGIVAPQIAAGAELEGESNIPLLSNLTRFIFLGNFLGLPAISVPVEYNDEGLPIGFHLMANHWEDALLLRMGHLLEHKHASPRRHPSDFYTAFL